MEYALLTEEGESDDYSDNFITSDDDYEDGLTWDSGDSRPAGPSPPSSANMNERPLVDLRARLRPRGRSVRERLRRPVVHELSSDEESLTVSSVTSTQSDPPSPTVSMFTNREFSAPVNDEDNLSDAETVMYEPPYSPHSPSLSPRSPINLSYSPHTPPGLPIVYSPHSPDYAPDDSSPSNEQVPEPVPNALETAAVPEIPQEPPVPAISPPLIETTETKVDAPKKTVPENLNSSTLSDCNEGSLCTICLDPLTNSGKHRVSCLRCGHIFGFSCLERWIKVGCSNGARRCPTCNKKACLKDIRVLFMSKVVPQDTVELDKLTLEKEELMIKKKVLEMEISALRLQNELNMKTYTKKLSKLEKELLDALNTIVLLQEGKKVFPSGITTEREKVKSELVHTVCVNKEGGCRVFAFNPCLQQLVVSQPSGNTVFAGFGVRVISSDFKPCRFMYLHHKMIRDMAFHWEDRDLLLSASLDQTAKLLDLSSNTVVHTFKGDGPLWSCCWDATNPHLLLTGSQMGKVTQYDRRMMDHYIHLWEDNTNFTPVVALAPVPSVAQTPFPQGGFISCRLNGVFAFSRHGEKYSSQELQLEGPFMSMRYEPSSQTLLTSARPSSRCPHVRITVNQLALDNQGLLSLPQIHTFNCGSSARVLSRLATMPVLDDTLIVAHHESGRSVNLWSSKSGNSHQSIPVHEPVIDITSINVNNKCLLATLSDKKVCIYKVR